MDENLVGYLLNSLDPATHEQVECQLRSSPEARRRLQILRQALEPLEEDRHILPPADLVVKTLARVAEHCCRELPRAPRPSRDAVPFSKPFWRRPDVLVAASLLLMAMTFAFPAVAYLRQRQNRLECQRNLTDYHQALMKYYELHGELPNVDSRGPVHNVAGMVAPILNDAGMLPSTASICCPAYAGFTPCTFTSTSLQHLSADEFQKQAPHLIPCYAYSLGYRDPNGNYGCFNARDGFAASQMPIMADQPPFDPTSSGNSPNHGGGGQNVLFFDGHVIYANQRTVGLDLDDIYLNRDKKVAAGIGCQDAVLGSSASRPLITRLRLSVK